VDLPDLPITLTFNHRVIFTRNAFSSGGEALPAVLSGKVLVFIDAGVDTANPGLRGEIDRFFRRHVDCLTLSGPPIVLPGGEACKNDWTLVEKLWAAINAAGIDRQSTILCIGGGAFLDLVGFAAATAHRGIRLVRLPTTTLSQGDGGVGVKNGVNFFDKKNWVGTFAVPWAVVNDFALLESLPPREKRAGLIEGVKVALLRDREFFEEIERRAESLAALERPAVEFVVQRSAELHVEHIATAGDPFEAGSARPLDFGHWIAHKIEPASGYRVGHGEAVAIGMAVDLVYAAHRGLLAANDCERSLELMAKIGFRLFDVELDRRGDDGQPVVLLGLEEFREHLGGELTITLVTGIGSSIEVHEMNAAVVLEAIAELRERAG
jgi:3-dehydroquinate synthase